MITDIDKLRAELWGSFLLFTRTFFPIVTGREFVISNPVGRESHFITIARELTKVSRLKTNNLLINVPPGHGKPLSKLTKVLTIDGERKPLGDLVVGDMVLTHKGRFKRVSQLFPQGELPTLKIKTFSGREIISAYDHSFLTAKGWSQAKDLMAGDCLGIAIPQSDFGHSLNAFQARLMGYFIGDGQVSHGHCNITAGDELIAKDIKKCCESLGFICNVKTYELSNRAEHYSKYLVKIHISNGSREWLIKEGLTGKNSYTKRVPRSIMLGDFETIKNFLGAYFACDGTFSKKAVERRDFSCSITSVSRDLLEDCQHLFVRLGIRSRIRKKVRNQKTAKQGDTYVSYNLEFSSQDDVYNFQKLIGDKIHHSKANMLKEHVFLRQRFDSEIQPDHIVDIEANGLVDCMCIEVEEDHTFTANDIVVHNSVLLSMWTAWNMSRYPDSQFLYISYGHDLAAKHTEFIKRVISCSHYKDLFGVHIRHDSKAKDYFRTTAGGTVKAFGSAAGIVGHDAGLPNLDRFSGAVILDDLHKIDEAHSATIRQKVIDNYRETIIQRPRGPNVPIVFIGQRVHEDDIAAYMLSGNDERRWETVILKSIDDAGNALYPEVNPLSQLLEKQDKNPYVFSAQFQQMPVPSGGALFKPEWFVILDEEPEIKMTFITADTAETNKSYNDATAFGFWGVYEIVTMGRKTGEYGLHWIDCAELRVEPKDLKDAFLDFWQDCMRHKVPPLMAAIEKKSTGTTLISVLQELRGMQIRNIERNRTSGSKTQRFLEVQPYLASRRVSFTAGAKHIQNCIDHMSKITAADTHRHDDIADVAADAIKIALIDKTLVIDTKQDTIKAATILQKQKMMLKARGTLYGSNQQNGF